MDPAGTRSHPRTIGWAGTVALAMGGSNQSLFVLGSLILIQGTGAVPLLVVGLLLSWMALPGWTELIMMWPDRVGGIAASCAEAFRPYSPVLANLTGVCYWWGWIPTCGLTAILSAHALHAWYLPGIPVHLLAALIIVLFTIVNLLGVRKATRLAVVIAAGSATLAFASAIIPVLSGHVDWHQAFSFHLKTMFHGAFGAVTSAMAGLYLIGFAAPAFEAAACHVGETRDPQRTVPRAMFTAAGMSTLYFVALPVIWLGAIGPHGLQGDLATTLGPTFAPLLAGAAKTAAVWFMVLNMFHGTLQPLAGAARTLSQLAEDGLLPKSWMRRNRFDAPWVTTTLTATIAVLVLQSGVPTWVIAAANLAYLIGIGMPSVAVWLLRRDDPGRVRPFRAPRGTVGLGLIAAFAWLSATVLGFEQYGLPTVIVSLALCYAATGLYAWRRMTDRRGENRPPLISSLHLKLSAAMVAVIALDGLGYLVAISHVPGKNAVLVAILKDIFVAVALLTVNVGLIIPGIISAGVGAVAAAARRLGEGTLTELTAAMQALARGDLDGAKASAEIEPIAVRSRDELGEMAVSFNRMQREVGRAALALDVAREELRDAKSALAVSAGRQAAVAQLGVRLMDVSDLDVLLAEVAQTARDVLGADGATVLEYHPVSRWPRIRASVGLLDDNDRQPIEDLAARSLRLEAGQELVVAQWSAYRAAAPAVLAAAGVQATLAVPIAERDRVFGLLSCECSSPRSWGSDELDTIRVIANLLAGATERSRAADEMRHRALHDPLTGLPNRTLFVDRLEQALVHARRHGRAVSVLFLDIDQFKLINDSLGHGAGDQLLRAVALRLSACMRAGDTVARFGGDEFVIIAEDLVGTEEAQQLAGRVREELSQPFVLGSAPHIVSASIGIAIGGQDGRGSEDLIREADAAMYRAKDSGRDGFAVYDEVMRASASRRLTIENELRQAITRQELRLLYQPQVRLPDAQMVGVEALVRWEHPRQGLLSPVEFIPIAEQTGAIVPLGEWVLRTAAIQASRWRRDYPQCPLSIAVNLSARQVADDRFSALVAELMSGLALPPGSLDLEITESVLMDSGEMTIDRLRELRSHGGRVVLDDFGTGYSSLAYVKRFPIDKLKIDREFVHDLSRGNRDASIVEAIIAMAQGLRVEVIAEGVETYEQAQLLTRLGCTHAQGYLLCEPVPPEEVARILAGETALQLDPKGTPT